MGKVLLYGRGANSIAEQLGESKEEGQKIIDSFFKSFPKVKKWIDDTHSKVKRLGYVEDWYGRRRHLPDVNLPKYTIKYTEKYLKTHITFNPFLICDNKVDDKLLKKYEDMLKGNINFKQFDKIKKDALYEGVDVISNNGFIARAERQSVNAIVQGGAATLTKLAMINIYNDEELNELGLKMLVPIHDELLCTCPKVNAERASQRLVEVMINAPKQFMNVPMSCDPYIEHNWYMSELEPQILGEFEHMCEEISREEAIEKICIAHCELERDNLISFLNGKDLVV